MHGSVSLRRRVATIGTHKHDQYSSESDNVSRLPLLQAHDTYADVTANTSARLALAKNVKQKLIPTLKAAIVHSYALSDSSWINTRIDAIGSMAAIMEVTQSVIFTTVVS